MSPFSKVLTLTGTFLAAMGYMTYDLLIHENTVSANIENITWGGKYFLVETDKGCFQLINGDINARGPWELSVSGNIVRNIGGCPFIAKMKETGTPRP